MLKMAVFVGLIGALSGCSIYRFEKTADGCSLSIYSARDVQTGGVRIGKDCAVSGRADSLTANEKSIDAINSLIQKIP